MAQDEGKSRMTDANRAALARALPRLTAEQIAEVSPKLKRLTYGPGEEIVRQGEPADRFYVLIRGQAEVFHQSLSGHVESIDVRQPGEYFGEIGLLHDSPRSATVRASRDGEVEVLAMDRADFREMIDHSRGTESQVARDMILRLIQLSDYQS
jgi:CRP-like cAMP-binding protein